MKKPAPTTPKTCTLIIWEQLPEAVDAYLIPNDELDAEDEKVLTAAQGQYINSSDMPEEAEGPLNCLNAAFSEPREGHYYEEHPKGSKWACRWAGKKIPIETATTGVLIDRVVRAGFLM